MCNFTVCKFSMTKSDCWDFWWLTFEILFLLQSEGYFALQDFDEFFYSVGPSSRHEKHGEVTKPGRDIPLVLIDDDDR